MYCPIFFLHTCGYVTIKNIIFCSIDVYQVVLSFYHIDCNSDVINGSVRYFFWAIGVMKKLLRAQ